MQTKLELHSYLGFDDARMLELLGEEGNLNVYAEVEEISFSYTSEASTTLFLHHATTVFPNLRSLSLDSPIIPDNYYGTILTDEDARSWPKLEHLRLEAMRTELGFLFELYDFPALRSLDFLYPTIKSLEALVANYTSWPNFKSLDLTTWQVQTHDYFVLLREGGLFTRLDRLMLDSLPVGTNIDAAYAMVDLVRDESIPKLWRRHLFKAISTPTNKKVLYNILKYIDAPVHSKMSRGQLDRVFEESLPDFLFSLDIYHQQGSPYDLTNLEDF